MMAEMHRLEAMIEGCKDEINKGVEDATSRSILRDIIYDSGVKIKCLESLLKAERESLISAVEFNNRDDNFVNIDGEDWFDVTFESYE